MKKLFPVIHFKNLETVYFNLNICLNNNCQGVILINMDNKPHELIPAIQLIRNITGNDFFIGVNFLNTDISFVTEQIIYNNSINGIWIDNPGLYYKKMEYPIYELHESFSLRKEKDQEFIFFGSVMFKTHVYKNDDTVVTKMAKNLGWIPTTSGRATGIAADIEKISIMKKHIGDYPLAIASGITPENVDLFLPYIDYYLVSTGISKNFYEFDDNKVKYLTNKINSF